MPRGGARTGSGRKPKTLEELRLSGTYRPSRHRHLQSKATQFTVVGRSEVSSDPRAIVSPIPDAVIAGLGAAGRRFTLALWADYEFNAAEFDLLRQTARTLDDAETATIPSDRRQATRLFANLLAQLGLKKEQ